MKQNTAIVSIFAIVVIVSITILVLKLQPTAEHLQGQALKPIISKQLDSKSVPEQELSMMDDPTLLFDWRNIHGLNFHTSVKSQSCCDFGDYLDCDMDMTYCNQQGGTYLGCGACYAFATIGTLEAFYNTYYNDLLPGLKARVS